MKWHKNSVKVGPKRQWGAERRTQPLSMLHEKPSPRKLAMSRLAIVTTVLLWAAYVVSTIIRQFFEGPSTFEFTMQAFGYLVVVTFLTFSALMYLVMRQGALQRFAKHVRVPRAKLDQFFSKHQPSITVLIPAVHEEPAVVRMTMLSAALQEYPNKRVVLLIDDNPNEFKNQMEADRFAETEGLAKGIWEDLREPRERFEKALKAYKRKYKVLNGNATPEEILELAEHYEWAANWLRKFAENEKHDDHVDAFFNEQVVDGLASDLWLVSKALRASSVDDVRLSQNWIHKLHQRLTWIFSVEVSYFVRKRYASLSKEFNKAMNLNSYIGLMGGTYRQTMTPDGPILESIGDAKPGRGDMVIPDSEFLLTLDADSILLREYCLRLVYFLEQPDNAQVAVTQTPYSSFRGANSRIERLSGATTDIQHILHQGMSQYGATFWVGANAVIRKRALEDIVEKEWIGGFEIRRYIQDRTVIEDTESSIDLGVKGWSLVNYPERLSYSATPPDFGSLVIQRRRWANGGLLILPKFWVQLRERKTRNEFIPRTEIMLRVNYMASIAWASFGLIFLLAFPYDGRLLSPFVVLGALPYFLCMASDLKYCGYKRTDVLRIYGFNLILLPVNLAGVLKSLQQALTGKKIPFARTPKVNNRTASPMLYVLAPLFVVGFSIFTMYRDDLSHNWGNFAFAAFNASVATWAIMAYIGLWHTVVDIWLGTTKWLYVDVPAAKTAVSDTSDPGLDWQAVLYHGNMHDALPISARGHLTTVAAHEEDV